MATYRNDLVATKKTQAHNVFGNISVFFAPIACFPQKCTEICSFIVFSHKAVGLSIQKFDFTVGEGKEWLNPSREKRQAPQKEGG